MIIILWLFGKYTNLNFFFPEKLYLLCYNLQQVNKKISLQTKMTCLSLSLPDPSRIWLLQLALLWTWWFSTTGLQLLILIIVLMCSLFSNCLWFMFPCCTMTLSVLLTDCCLLKKSDLRKAAVSSGLKQNLSSLPRKWTGVTWMWLWRKLSTKELMLLNCGVGEDSWESLGLQGDPTSPSQKRSVLGVHWKDWCWSWNSNILATWCKELTHLKRPWCWERLKVGGEGNDRGWHGWMASPTHWTWVWVSSRSWWWTGRPGVVHGVEKCQTQLSDWTELNWNLDKNQGS